MWRRPSEAIDGGNDIAHVGHRFRQDSTSMQAAAHAISSECSRSLRVSEAARSNSVRASACRCNLNRKSPRTLGSR